MGEAINLKQSSFQSTKGVITKNTALLISCNEDSNITISNELMDNFETSARTYKNLKDGLDYLMDHTCQLIVIDLDSIDKDSFDRVEQLVSFKQIPTILLSNNPNADEEFKVPKDHLFIEFIITSSLKKHFVKSTSSLFSRTGSGIKIQHRLNKISAGKKPNSFYFIAALLFCEPILKTLYMKYSTGFDFEVVFRTIFSMEGIVSNFEYWLMFPIAGIALVSEKSWSFLVFMLVQAYCIFAHFYYVEFTWPYVSDSPHVSSAFLMIINTVVILYFLVPEHRRPFWNKSQKLWRNTSRYATSLPTYLSTGGEKQYTAITNISKTGAYFISKENISIGEKTHLQFIIDGQVHEVEATVKRTHNTEVKNEYGYGVEFGALSQPIKEVIEDYIEGLGTKIQ